jgi:hypothetical protein
MVTAEITRLTSVGVVLVAVALDLASLPLVYVIALILRRHVPLLLPALLPSRLASAAGIGAAAFAAGAGRCGP